MPNDLMENQLQKMTDEVVKEILFVFILPYVLVSIIVIFIITTIFKKVSIYLTKPLIDLQYKIQQIMHAYTSVQHDVKTDDIILSSPQQKTTKELNFIVNYKNRNKEINFLYHAFSNLTKTLSVANTSLESGDANQALLNYHEAMSVFHTLHNVQKKGSCLNNIGCLYLKINQFQNAITFLDESIKIANEFQACDEQSKFQNQFILGCRHYNKALCCYTNLQKLIET